MAAALRGAAAGAGGGALTAPMPGTVTVVKVAKGDEVVAGQSLLVVEAMKMEHVITAPHDGTVTEIDVTAGAARSPWTRSSPSSPRGRPGRRRRRP